MEREVSRWLAPAGASVAVLAVFVVPGITPDLPAEPIETQGTTARAVEITGYRSQGRTLTVFYTVDQSTDCSSRIRPPVTRERSDAVVVFLERRVSRAPDQVCAHLMLANSVEVPLRSPLADRVVQDGGYDGALVPLEAADVERVVSTPPTGRAGR
jgi:hypothetical protein